MSSSMGNRRLTPREVEVIQLISEGLANDAIGRQLYISGNTVATHVKNILRKLGTRTRTGAAAQYTALHTPLAAKYEWFLSTEGQQFRLALAQAGPLGLKVLKELVADPDASNKQIGERLLANPPVSEDTVRYIISLFWKDCQEKNHSRTRTELVVGKMAVDAVGAALMNGQLRSSAEEPPPVASATLPERHAAPHCSLCGYYA